MESTDRSTTKISCGGVYLLLLVPVTLFTISLFIRPAMVFDTAAGFAVFRSMLEGAPFNYGFSPDPSNIANDIETFLTWWSPGQYLVPGAFVWLDTSYGLAISLTALLASVIGVLGWIWIARGYEVSCFVLSFFVAGLVAFHYTTSSFRLYSGGEVLLFAALPWSLSALVWAAQRRPLLSFAISLMAAVLLFFAKLSGLFAFAATVAAISLLDLWKRRQLTSSLLAMWAGSMVAALLIYAFWVARGPTPVTGAAYTITWPIVLFPIAAAVFSGYSLHELLDWLFLHPSAPILSGITQTSYVLGPLGLVLLGWAWFRLRKTRYRPMAIFLLAIIAIYTAAFIAMYVRSATVVPFEERYFRYAGILSFLLLLVAIDQWQAPLAKVIPILIVATFAAYGLTSYANAAREFARGDHYDQASGTSMLSVSPVVLEYLRSEMAVHHWQHAIAVVPEPEAANGLPGFRIIFSFHLLDSAPLEDITHQRWAGRTDKIFVIMNRRMRGSGKEDAVLKTFVDYDFEAWDRKEIDGMLVDSQ
ncbi:MAG: hypothetical protein WAL80_05700 [Xanthobacteraceae bacterium]